MRLRALPVFYSLNNLHQRNYLFLEGFIKPVIKPLRPTFNRAIFFQTIISISTMFRIYLDFPFILESVLVRYISLGNIPFCFYFSFIRGLIYSASLSQRRGMDLLLICLLLTLWPLNSEAKG